MFILVTRKETKQKVAVNMNNVTFISDGIIYFVGNSDYPLYVEESMEDMRSQMPYGGADI